MGHKIDHLSINSEQKVLVLSIFRVVLFVEKLNEKRSWDTVEEEFA